MLAGKRQGPGRFVSAWRALFPPRTAEQAAVGPEASVAEEGPVASRRPGDPADLAVSRPDRASALQRAGEFIKGFVQGEVISAPNPCVIVIDRAWPLSDAAELVYDVRSSGLSAISTASDTVVLLTQTCDLQETNSDEHLCQVTRVVEVDAGEAEKVLRGHFPGMVALPWHSPGAIARLAEITTIERSVLVGSESLSKPRNDAERIHFSEMTGRHFSRFAFPDDVSEIMRPLRSRMKEKHDKGSPEGSCASMVQTIHLEASPLFDADLLDLNVLFILKTSDLQTMSKEVRDALDGEAIDRFMSLPVKALADSALKEVDPSKQRELWTALAELWLRGCLGVAEAKQSIGTITAEVLNGTEFTFERSRSAPELDFGYLSTRPRKQ